MRSKQYQADLAEVIEAAKLSPYLASLTARSINEARQYTLAEWLAFKSDFQNAIKKG